MSSQICFVLFLFLESLILVMKISTKTSDFLPEVGNRIKQTRNALGLTQEELASVLGVTRGALANWERGARLADAGAMSRFARSYRISLDWLYMGDMSQLSNAMTKAILGKRSFLSTQDNQKRNNQNLVKSEV